MPQMPKKVRDFLTKRQDTDIRDNLTSIRRIYTELKDTIDHAPQFVSQYGADITEINGKIAAVARKIPDAPNPIDDIDNVQTETAALLKELKKYEKKIKAEMKAQEQYQVGVNKSSDVIRSQLEQLYIENQKILDEQQAKGVTQNPLLLLAQDKIKDIINGLARAKDVEIGLLRQMATRIILSSDDEMRKIKEGKDKDSPKTGETALNRTNRRRDNLATALTTLGNQLNALSDHSKHVLTPPGEHDVVDARYKRNRENKLAFDKTLQRFVNPDLKSHQQFKEMELLHKEFEKFKEEAVAENVSILRSLYLKETRTEDEIKALRVHELRAQMYQDRLELYKKYLDSVPYNNGTTIQERLTPDTGEIAKLEKTLRETLALKNKLGYLGTKVEILTNDELGVDFANVAKDEELLDSGISEPDAGVKHEENFDPKTHGRVIHNAFTKQDGTMDDFITIQKNIGDRFYSNFRYSRQDLEKLSEKDQFVLAIREAENFLRKVKDPNMPVRLTGDWPKSFVQNIVDYMALNHVVVDNQTVDSSKWFQKIRSAHSDVSPGSFSKRNLAKKLESDGEMRKLIFGTDAPLAFTKTANESSLKEVHATQKDLAQYVTQRPVRPTRH